jgi:hypothetical protein
MPPAILANSEKKTRHHSDTQITRSLANKAPPCDCANIQQLVVQQSTIEWSSSTPWSARWLADAPRSPIARANNTPIRRNRPTHQPGQKHKALKHLQTFKLVMLALVCRRM